MRDAQEVSHLAHHDRLARRGVSREARFGMISSMGRYWQSCEFRLGPMNHKGFLHGWRRLQRRKRRQVVEQVKTQNTGVISIKLVGEGSFASREDRQVSLKFAFNNAGVDVSPSAT